MKKKMRKLLIAAMFLISLPAMSDNSEWYLLTTSRQGNGCFPMATVGSLIGVDTTNTLTVLDTSGNILAENIDEASFSQEPTKITELNPYNNTNLLQNVVESKLTIIGAVDDITIYNMGGMMVVHQKPDNGQTVVEVSHLPSGTYVVKTGRQIFRFIKK